MWLAIGMGHGHDHGGASHGASPTDRASTRRRLALTLGLSATYMVAEAVGGWMTGSLALLADAGHMLSDVAALALSLFAFWIAERPPTPRRSFGYYRTEILAALANGAALLAIGALIVIEAVERFAAPPEVDAPVMLGIATGGLVINLVALKILSAGRDSSLNMRGAWLHVLTDALGSVAAIISGLVMWRLGWNWADPLASVIIVLLVAHSAWALLKETLAVLMEWAPGHIDPDALVQGIKEQEGVDSVHDLHVWTITSGLVCMSAHIVVAAGVDHQAVLHECRAMLRERFHIGHTTVQVEVDGFGDTPCVCDAVPEAS